MIHKLLIIVSSGPPQGHSPKLKVELHMLASSHLRRAASDAVDWFELVLIWRAHASRGSPPRLLL
jgi:hypothetical protein